jgi:hypothetical protein
MHKKWILISLTGLILLSLIVACAQSTTPETALEIVSDDTRTLIVEKCSDCHSTNLVFESDYSREEWSDVFDNMISKGADVNPNEKTIMIEWLVSQD